MKRRKRLAAIAVVGLVLVSLVCLLLFVFVEWYFSSSLDGKRAHQQALLESTDHQALRTACREMLSDKEHYKPGKWRYWANTIEQPLYPGDVPKAIQSLKPMHISVDQNSVWIDWGGGFGHWGLRVFEEDANETDAIKRMEPGGNRVAIFKRIIEGVWFYDVEG